MPDEFPMLPPIPIPQPEVQTEQPQAIETASLEQPVAEFNAAIENNPQSVFESMQDVESASTMGDGITLDDAYKYIEDYQKIKQDALDDLPDNSVYNFLYSLKEDDLLNEENVGYLNRYYTAMQDAAVQDDNKTELSVNEWNSYLIGANTGAVESSSNNLSDEHNEKPTDIEQLQSVPTTDLAIETASNEDIKEKIKNGEIKLSLPTQERSDVQEVNKEYDSQLAAKYLGKPLDKCSEEELAQACALDMIISDDMTYSNMFNQQLEKDGLFSDLFNDYKEVYKIHDAGVSRSEVAEAIAEQNERNKKLSAALNGETEESFNDLWKQYTGKEFSVTAAREYQQERNQYYAAQAEVNSAYMLTAEAQDAKNIDELASIYADYFGGSKEEAKAKIQSLQEQYDNTFNSSIVGSTRPDEKQHTSQDRLAAIEKMLADEAISSAKKRVDYENTLEKYEATKKGFIGNGDLVEQLVTQYCESQESFADTISAVGSVAGMALCLTGVGAGVGGALIVGSTFIDNGIEAVDILTSNMDDEAKKDALKQQGQEALLEGTLMAAGYGINGVAEIAGSGLAKLATTKGASDMAVKAAGLVGEVGTDTLLNAGVNYVAKGELNLGGELLASLGGTVLGKATSKLRKNNASQADESVKTTQDIDMSEYTREIEYDANNNPIKITETNPKTGDYSITQQGDDGAVHKIKYDSKGNVTDEINLSAQGIYKDGRYVAQSNLVTSDLSQKIESGDIKTYEDALQAGYSPSDIYRSGKGKDIIDFSNSKQKAEYMTAMMYDKMGVKTESDVNAMLCQVAQQAGCTMDEAKDAMKTVVQFSSYSQIGEFESALQQAGITGFVNTGSATVNTALDYIARRKGQFDLCANGVRGLVLDESGLDYLRKCNIGAIDQNTGRIMVDGENIQLLAVDGWNIKLQNGQYANYSFLSQSTTNDKDLIDLISGVASGQNSTDAITQEAISVLENRFGIQLSNNIPIISNHSSGLSNDISVSALTESMKPLMSEDWMQAFFEEYPQAVTSVDSNIVSKKLIEYFDDNSSFITPTTSSQMFREMKSGIDSSLADMVQSGVLPQDFDADKDVIYVVAGGANDRKSFDLATYQYLTSNGIDHSNVIQWNGEGTAPISLDGKAIVVVDDIVGSGNSLVSQQFGLSQFARNYNNTPVIMAPLSTIKAGKKYILDEMDIEGINGAVVPGTVVDVSGELKHDTEMEMVFGYEGYGHSYAATFPQYMFPDNNTDVSQVAFYKNLRSHNGSAYKVLYGAFLSGSGTLEAPDEYSILGKILTRYNQISAQS